MSFILDALRKSEHERQRQAGPVMADLSVTPRRSRAPLALLIVSALLVVNLVAVAYFLLRGETPAALPDAPAVADSVATPVAAPVPAGAAVPQPVAQPAVQAQRLVQPLAAEANPAMESPAPDATPPPAPDPLLLPPAPVAASPRPLPAPQPATTGGDFLPRLDTLPPQATAGLPVLNLDLHIYASDPAQRAAFINGRRYREGDTLPEGIEVAAITPDGAVLRHRGQRFLLPRP